MIKKLIIGISCVLLLGGILFGVGIAMDYKTKPDINSGMTTNETQTSQESNKEMNQFSNVEISVIGADIYLVEGEKYGVEYKFHNREIIERLEITNDTLYLSTGYNWEWKPDNGDWRVIVTVPKGTPLNNINLSTVAGNLVVENRAYTDSSLTTTSGEITLSNITADEVEAKTVSGAISVNDSKVQKLCAENKTGNIKLYGEFGTVDAYSVSSQCELNGSISQSASIETISSEITVAVSNSASVEANTYGNLYWNGQKQGYSFAKADGNAKLTLKSKSGNIRVTEGSNTTGSNNQ